MITDSWLLVESTLLVSGAMWEADIDCGIAPFSTKIKTLLFKINKASNKMNLMRENCINT